MLSHSKRLSNFHGFHENILGKAEKQIKMFSYSFRFFSYKKKLAKCLTSAKIIRVIFLKTHSRYCEKVSVNS
jgi:hypothetical protein